MKVVKLMILTNEIVAARLLNGKYNDLVWASGNIETVAHYYKGAVVGLEVTWTTS